MEPWIFVFEKKLYLQKIAHKKNVQQNQFF